MTPMDLVLSNFLTQPQDVISGASLAKNMRPWMSAEQVEGYCKAAEAQGLVQMLDTPRGRGKTKKAVRGLALTAAGEKHLQRVLGLKGRLRWAELQAHWVCRGLQISASKANLQAVATATGLARVVLLSACGTPGSSVSDKEALTALVWNAMREPLGISVPMPTGAWCTDELKRIVLVTWLRLAAKTSLVAAKQALCAAHVGSPAGDARSLRHTLVARATQNVAPAGSAKSEAVKLPQGAPTAEPTLAHFVRAVQGATAQCGEHYHGQDVLIVHVWNAYRKHAGPSESLDNFKTRLVSANQQGLVQLSRADLAHLFDQAEIKASEIRVSGGALHFIRHGGRI